MPPPPPPPRPYLYASYLLAASCFPYVIVKTFLYNYQVDGVAAAAMFVLTGAFSWIHVFAARWVGGGLGPGSRWWWADRVCAVGRPCSQGHSSGSMPCSKGGWCQI